MLVLTRKEGERIMIGEDIVITILNHRAGQVKLGINAPKKISVHREEVYLRILEEGETKSESTSLYFLPFTFAMRLFQLAH